MNKSSTFFGVALISALTLSGCSVIQSVTSEAYALGLGTGQEFSGAKEFGDNYSSWFPDEGESPYTPTPEEEAEAMRLLCKNLWPALGMASGLENSDANESDFVSGCLDGAGF